ncbi:MAG: GNAT family N-acetyltransferase [Ferruginibacter sp.]
MIVSNIEIRKIEKTDNPLLAKIIRNALEEFNANKPGTVYFDESTDHLFELFEAANNIYNVVLINNEVVGGAGIFDTEGLDDDTCELVKMYLSPKARGKGIAKLLMTASLEAAKNAGFKKIYLETMPELKNAIPLYEKSGFTYLPHALGNTGHNGCGVWMIKSID